MGSVRAFSRKAIEQIKQLFPNLDQQLRATDYVIPDGRAQKQLIQEHIATAQSLVG